jgi:hypothetical protein
MWSTWSLLAVVLAWVEVLVQVEVEAVDLLQGSLV